jgi:NTE family protein
MTDRMISLMPFAATPMQNWFEAMARYFSPYELNPLNINPLSQLIERLVDFDALRANTDLALYVSATNVHTGRLRIFANEKITADVVMASAALPFMFRAVEIEGVPYWDGGYMGNPRSFPFCTQPKRKMSWWCRSIRYRATPRRKPPAKSSTV